MYRDKTVKKYKIILIAVLAIICAGLVILLVAKSPAIKGSSDAEGSIRTAVLQSALQCYAVEGAYPPSLDYLTENYGLRINTVDYYVTYDAFAQNQLPDVRVTKRAH